MIDPQPPHSVPALDVEAIKDHLKYTPQGCHLSKARPMMLALLAEVDRLRAVPSPQPETSTLGTCSCGHPHFNHGKPSIDTGNVCEACALGHQVCLNYRPVPLPAVPSPSAQEKEE